MKDVCGGNGGLYGFDGRDLSLFWIGIGDFGCTGTRVREM